MKSAIRKAQQHLIREGDLFVNSGFLSFTGKPQDEKTAEITNDRMDI